MKTITVSHYKDTEGTKLVSVPLSNDKRLAILNEEDFNDLMQQGISPVWKIYNNQVTTRYDLKDVPISRLIRNAGAGTRVELVDGNICNLRRANLVLVEGYSIHAARSKLVKPYKQRAHLVHLYDGANKAA